MSKHDSFIKKLTRTIERNNSLLCVGLDPDPINFPNHFTQPTGDPALALARWGQGIIEQTSDLVCCYKPNFAFYERHGPAGLEALRQTIAAVPNEIPVLLDAKRGDIGNTAGAYAQAAFEVWQADAITVNPYLGQDSIAPFLAFPGKAVFVLCYTSNPSAGEIQMFGNNDRVLFEHVIRQAQSWGTPDQVGFVVGATRPEGLARCRALAPDRWILMPGVGAQGGNLHEALAAGLNPDFGGVIVPLSRRVIYDANTRQITLTLREQINQVRQRVKPAKSAASPHRDLILRLHEDGCVQFGNFTLASGQTSPIYIDLRRIASEPSLLRMAARAYSSLIKPLTLDRLAAVPYGALTLGTAVALTLNKPLIYPRKEVKAHGTGKSIEGVFSAGERVVVIEDLVTTGGSVLDAIEKLEASGLVVEDVAVLIDREQGGRENLANRGYRLHAALSLSEVLTTLHEAGRISAETLGQVQRYLSSARSKP